MQHTKPHRMRQLTTALSGYGDTHGTSFVVETFNRYLEIQDLNPSRLKVTDHAINDFVDFFLAQETGRLCQSEEGRILLETVVMLVRGHTLFDDC